jgi:GMP synthase (glutamine-hydrolysing)
MTPLPPPRPLLILKVGDALPHLRASQGDFEDWIAQGLSPLHLPTRILDPRQGAALPHPDSLAGVIITGSHAMVTDPVAWIARGQPWLLALIESGVPVLGLCFGHQWLAQALGGSVHFHPGGTEIGTVQIERQKAAEGDPLLSSLPPRFLGHAVHEQSIAALPAGAMTLASNAWEAHHAVRFAPRAWGLQFHPEFDQNAMRGYIEDGSQQLRRHGRDPKALLAAVRPTPVAAGLLRRFGDLVANPHLTP